MFVKVKRHPSFFNQIDVKGVMQLEVRKKLRDANKIIPIKIK